METSKRSLFFCNHSGDLAESWGIWDADGTAIIDEKEKREKKGRIISTSNVQIHTYNSLP